MTVTLHDNINGTPVTVVEEIRPLVEITVYGVPYMVDVAVKDMLNTLQYERDANYNAATKLSDAIRRYKVKRETCASYPRKSTKAEKNRAYIKMVNLAMVGKEDNELFR